jgi:hypothetical protein
VLPSSFYGTIQVDGANVEPGTSIKALIENQVFAEGHTLMYEGTSVYTINVPGDDNDSQEVDGGREGDEIIFEIGGLVADQTGTWHSGTNVELNLTASYQDQDSETVIIATPSPIQATVQPKVTDSTQSTQSVQETTEIITQTESPEEPIITTGINPTPTIQSVQVIQTPNQSGGTTPISTVVNNPEPTLSETQVNNQIGTPEQSSSFQDSPSLDQSSPGNQLDLLSSTEFVLGVGGIIVIVLTSIWLWTKRK